MEDHEVTIKDLHLRPDCVFNVMDRKSSEKAIGKPRSSTSQQPEGIKTVTFKVMSEPRENKRLLVLDIDRTIYDPKAPNTALAARPFLHEFLKGVYEEYDIAIWSATELAVAEKKLAVLDMIENPNFKLVFALDLKAMPKVLLEEGYFFVSIQCVCVNWTKPVSLLISTIEQKTQIKCEWR